MKTIITSFIIALGMAIGFFIGVLILLSGIDNSIDRQNTMLCESAKISGNMEYLEKCDSYYNGENIKYMR